MHLGSGAADLPLTKQEPMGHPFDYVVCPGAWLESGGYALADPDH
jgi:hypothetical protein